MIIIYKNGTSETAKLCKCKKHVGPHWYFLDLVKKKQNESFSGVAFVLAEISRMKSLEANFSHGNILEIKNA